MKRLWKILSVVVVVFVAVVVGGIAVLKSQDFNEYKGLIAEQAKAATGRDLAIAGDLNLEISLNPALAVEGVSFANAPWGSRPEMATLKRLEAQVAIMPLLFGNIEVDRLVLVGLDLIAETNAKGKGNWEFDTTPSADKAKEEAPASGGGANVPVVRAIRIEDVSVAYKDGKTGEEMNVKLDRLEAGADSASDPMMVAIAGSYNGAPYSVDGSVGSVNALSGGGNFPVDLAAKAFDATVTIKGAIANAMAGKGLNLTLTKDIANLKGTLQAVGKAVPALADAAATAPAVPIKFSGRLTDPDGGYVFEDLKLNVGRTDFAGRAGVKLGKRPHVTASLTSTLLDVDELSPAKPKKADDKKEAASAEKTEKKAKAKRVFPADPLPLDGLKAADADISIKVKTIKASGLAMGDADIKVSLKAGKLNVNPAAVTLAGGRISSVVSLDGARKTPALAIKVDGKNVDYGKLLKQFDATDVVTGNLNIDVDVKGAGASVRSMMAGLNGHAKVVSKGGKIEMGGLSVLSAGLPINELTSKLSGKAEGAAKSFDAQQLRCMLMDFRINKGKADGKYLLVETGGFAMVGKGGVNLADETIGLRFDPRAKDANVSKLLQPVKVGGTFAEPSFGIEAEKAIAGAALGAAAASAVATGGLSLVVGALVGAGAASDTDTTDYCALAFAGKPLKPQSSGDSKKSSSDSKAPAKKEEGGIGGALKGLFGK